MELTKTILILISISSLLSLSVDAHRPPSTGGSFKLDSSISAELSKCVSFPTLPLISIHPSLLQTCSVTKNPIRCASFIAPFVTNIGVADPSLVLNMNIEALYKVVLRAKSVAIKISKAKSTPILVRTSLNKCVHLYDNAIDNLAKASTACSAHNTALVKILLSGAISDFGHCEKAFKKNGLASVMNVVDHNLIELAGYGLDISTKLVIKVNL